MSCRDLVTGSKKPIYTNIFFHSLSPLSFSEAVWPSSQSSSCSPLTWWGPGGLVLNHHLAISPAQDRDAIQTATVQSLQCAIRVRTQSQATRPGKDGVRWDGKDIDQLRWTTEMYTFIIGLIGINWLSFFHNICNFLGKGLTKKGNIHNWWISVLPPLPPSLSTSAK